MEKKQICIIKREAQQLQKYDSPVFVWEEDLEDYYAQIVNLLYQIVLFIMNSINNYLDIFIILNTLITALLISDQDCWGL